MFTAGGLAIASSLCIIKGSANAAKLKKSLGIHANLAIYLILSQGNWERVCLDMKQIETKYISF